MIKGVFLNLFAFLILIYIANCKLILVDYNEETEIITLMENGRKFYPQFKNEENINNLYDNNHKFRMLNKSEQELSTSEFWFFVFLSICKYIF
jgi:hypothetical protein